MWPASCRRNQYVDHNEEIHAETIFRRHRRHERRARCGHFVHSVQPRRTGRPGRRSADEDACAVDQPAAVPAVTTDFVPQTSYAMPGSAGSLEDKPKVSVRSCFGRFFIMHFPVAWRSSLSHGLPFLNFALVRSGPSLRRESVP